MGITKVGMKVKNLGDPRRVFEGEFLVDGKIIKRKVGSALYEYQGLERAAPVMFGQRGDSLLLGMFTLEALGLSLDPLKRELYKATLRL